MNLRDMDRDHWMVAVIAFVLGQTFMAVLWIVGIVALLIFGP